MNKISKTYIFIIFIIIIFLAGIYIYSNHETFIPNTDPQYILYSNYPNNLTTDILNVNSSSTGISNSELIDDIRNMNQFPTTPMPTAPIPTTPIPTTPIPTTPRYSPGINTPIPTTYGSEINCNDPIPTVDPDGKSCLVAGKFLYDNSNNAYNLLSNRKNYFNYITKDNLGNAGFTQLGQQCLNAYINSILCNSKPTTPSPNNCPIVPVQFGYYTCNNEFSKLLYDISNNNSKLGILAYGPGSVYVNSTNPSNITLSDTGNKCINYYNCNNPTTPNPTTPNPTTSNPTTSNPTTSNPTCFIPSTASITPNCFNVGQYIYNTGNDPARLKMLNSKTKHYFIPGNTGVLNNLGNQCLTYYQCAKNQPTIVSEQPTTSS